MLTDSEGEEPGVLRAIPRDRLIDRASRAIKDFILANELSPGDRMPSESELARSLGVSRNVVRQAVSSLEAIGVVRVEHGRGIYVADVVDTDVFSKIAGWLNTSDLEEEEFFEARSIFEQGIFELVIARATDADFDRLEHIGTALRDATDDREIGRLHVEFHRALLEMTGNQFLVTLGTILSRFFWSVGYDSPHIHRWSPHSLGSSHLPMVELLRGRRREDIPAMIRLHLAYHEHVEHQHRPAQGGGGGC